MLASGSGCDASRCRGGDPPSDQQAQHRCGDTELAGDHERRRVRPEPGTAGAGTPRRERAAQLMGGEHPREDDTDPFGAEPLSAYRDRRWDGRDPVEAVEDDERREAEASVAERRVQTQKRQAPQAVVPEQQQPRSDPFGQPSDATVPIMSNTPISPRSAPPGTAVMP